MKPEMIGSIICPGCTSTIGELIRLKGRLALYRSGLTVFVGFFRCGLCGATYHFDGNKISVEKMQLNGIGKVAKTAHR